MKEEKRKRGRNLKRGRDIVEDDGRWRAGEVPSLVVNDDQDKYLSTITIILLLLHDHYLI